MLQFFYAPDFVKQAKHLSKKYPSFADDLEALMQQIIANPLEGVDLGAGVRKIRMAIKSKGRGKSGGARVITLNLHMDEETRKVTMLTVYDKSEKESISDAEISRLMDSIKED